MDRSLAIQNRQYQTVALAIEYIRAHARRQPSLKEIAAAVNFSEYHLQRVFASWAGISPKRFLQYLTKEHAKQALHESLDVLSATQDAGLSSPGRLHDLMITCEAMTPGEIKQGGRGVSLTYGLADTPFGTGLIAWTSRGICNMAFCEDQGEQQALGLQSQWSAATLVRDDDAACGLSGRIFPSDPRPGKLSVLLHGTNFQLKVWEALLQIGSSRIVSYSTLARMAGSPNAQRAVGSALAANRLAYLIPCHRVIRESGDVGEYRWGGQRKLAIQAWETARSTRQITARGE